MQQKEYYTYEEAMEILGISRSTLQTMLNDQGVKYHKFRYDKKKYLSDADVKRLKQMREKPWLAGEESKEDAVA